MTSRRQQITLQPEVLRWARERAGLFSRGAGEKDSCETGTRYRMGRDRQDQHRPRRTSWLPKRIRLWAISTCPEAARRVAAYTRLSHARRRSPQTPESRPARHRLPDAAAPGLDARRPDRRRRGPAGVRRRLQPDGRLYGSCRGDAGCVWVSLMTGRKRGPVGATHFAFLRNRAG